MISFSNRKGIFFLAALIIVAAGSVGFVSQAHAQDSGCNASQPTVSPSSPAVGSVVTMQSLVVTGCPPEGQPGAAVTMVFRTSPPGAFGYFNTSQCLPNTPGGLCTVTAVAETAENYQVCMQWTNPPQDAVEGLQKTCTSGTIGPAPQGNINVTSVDTNGNPVSASWTISGPATLSGSGTSQSYSNEPAGSTYGVTPGPAPANYSFVSVSNPQTLNSGGTIGFTIVWKKQTPQQPPLTCTASASSAQVGQTVTFTGGGGNGSYIWPANSNGANPPSGSGATFSTQFSQSGSNTVTIDDSAGDPAGSCSVNITSSTPPPPPPPPPPPSGSITASPNPCTILSGQTTCTSDITWSTTNVSVAKVYVTSGATTNLFSGSTSCSGANCPAPWIVPAGDTFTLDDCSSATCVPLSSVTVTGVMGSQTPITGKCSPTAGECTAGTAINVNTASCQTTWSCQGSDGGTTASCSVAAPVNGTWGSWSNPGQQCGTRTCNGASCGGTCSPGVGLQACSGCGGNGETCCSGGGCGPFLSCSPQKVCNPSIPICNSGLYLTPSSYTCTVGGTATFSAIDDGATCVDTPVTNLALWKSYNPSIASSEGDGKFSCLTAGTVPITVQFNDQSPEATITVIPPSTITGVVVSCPGQLTVNSAGTCTATVDGTPPEGFNPAVTWSYSPLLGTLTSTTVDQAQYIAPGSPTAVVVKATSVQDPTKSNTATIQVVSGGSSCTTLTYNPFNSGFSTSPSGPAIAPLTVDPGSTFYTFVDYGQANSSSIQPPSDGEGDACSGTGVVYTGTVARFTCTANSTAGTYPYSTNVNAGTADNDCGSGSQAIGSVVVSSGSSQGPPGPPSCSFTASENTVVPPESSTLSWSCQNTTACTMTANGTSTAISSGSDGDGSFGGSTTVSPSEYTLYELTCTGGSGSTQDTQIVSVSSPNIHEINPSCGGSGQVCCSSTPACGSGFSCSSAGVCQ
jgi:hypothetical protein